MAAWRLICNFWRACSTRSCAASALRSATTAKTRATAAPRKTTPSAMAT
ncbi:MAG TPA: hypothetical protein VF654_05505 [Pyrinomonadaceae bacterium]